MKKLTILLVAALIPMMVLAQAKRKPAAGKPATAAKTVNNKFAIILFDEWIQNVYEDAGNIYFQGTKYDELNTLRAADKQTGALRFVVPKKKRERSKIICSGCDGTNIYMQLEEKGIVRFNGTDVNTSEVLVPEGPNGQETYYIWPANRGEAMSFSPNGRFLAMKADPCIVVDTQTQKVVRMVRNTEEGFLVTDNGDFYAIRENGLWKYPNNGGVHPNESNKLNEKGIEKFGFEKLTGNYYGEYHGMYADAGQQAIYLPVRNKLLKFTLGNQQWSEAFAFDNESQEFGRMAFSSQHIFACTNDYAKPFCEWAGMNLATQPKTIDKLNTGIKLGTSPYESSVVVNLVQSLYYDTQGNLWMQTSDKQFVVYNPDGIKGLSSLIGKCTKHEIQ